MIRYRLAPVLAVALGLGLAGTVAVGALGQDNRLALCPVDGNRVLAAFEVERARDVARVLPRMLRSPELEVDTAAFIVLFDGPTQLTVHGAPPADDAPPVDTRRVGMYDGVVCVVVGGSATVYSDVDITGWAKPR